MVMHIDEIKMLDARDVDTVEVLINHDKTLWVNVNGICMLRIVKPRDIEVTDNRPLVVRRVTHTEEENSLRNVQDAIRERDTLS